MSKTSRSARKLPEFSRNRKVLRLVEDNAAAHRAKITITGRRSMPLEIRAKLVY